SESLFGALLVLFGWVAGDISTGRLLIRPFHVTNTFSLMAALALTPLWASRGTARRPALSGAGLRIVWPAVLGALALAWTGAWTGLATTAFAPATLQEGLDQYQDPEHLLIPLRLLHPVLAVGVTALLLRTAARLRRPGGDPLAARLGTAVAILAVAQLAVGAGTILLGNPALARLFHLLVADAIWILLILAGATTLERAARSAPAV